MEWLIFDKVVAALLLLLASPALLLLKIAYVIEGGCGEGMALYKNGENVKEDYSKGTLRKFMTAKLSEPEWKEFTG